MATLQERIEQDLTTAMKGGDNIARDTLRMLKTAIKNREIEKGGELQEDDLVALLRKEAKQRQEAIDQYKAAGRAEQADKEEQEKQLIEGYLPAGLSDEELTKIVDEAIKATSATSIKEIGAVMKEVMSKVAGRADGRQVSDMVRSKLS